MLDLFRFAFFLFDQCCVWRRENVCEIGAYVVGKAKPSQLNWLPESVCTPWPCVRPLKLCHTNAKLAIGRVKTVSAFSQHYLLLSLRLLLLDENPCRFQLKMLCHRGDHGRVNSGKPVFLLHFFHFVVFHSFIQDGNRNFHWKKL